MSNSAREDGSLSPIALLTMSLDWQLLPDLLAEPAFLTDGAWEELLATLATSLWSK